MQPRIRAILMVICMACGFTGISYKLVQIQLVDHEKYREIAMANHLLLEKIPPIRGSIYDNDGNLLAETQQRTDLHLDGKLVEHPAEQFSVLSQILQIPADQLSVGFDPRRRDIHLADNLDDTVVAKLKALKWDCLILTAHDLRFYPNNELAAHLLGILDGNGHGLMGIEKQMDLSLTGFPGERWIDRDGKGKAVAAYEARETPKIDGNDVRLTINMPIQHVIEDQLDQIVKTYQPDAAYIIVMEPHTGQILAMDSRPTFDPNDSTTFQQENIRNRCIEDGVEPGSIFKVITMAGALNEGLINLNTPINCENGDFHYGGKELHDDGESHGILPAIEVMSQSSNIGFAKIGMALHEERLYKYATAFGIGERTGLFGDQGESAGLLRPVNKWSALSITRVPFGQEVLATPIQMATAMCVIANGGHMVAPQLVARVTDRSTGRVLQEFQPRVLRQVVSATTAREVTRALEQVTIDGTAKKIRITYENGEGLSYVAKTGTAQKFINGEYSHTEHVASFLGFVPAEDPAFVTLVMVDNPHTAKNQDYGAEVSGPVFANVAKQVAQILNVPPDLPAPSAAPTLTSNSPSAL